jgi:hypothetical protein
VRWYPPNHNFLLIINQAVYSGHCHDSSIFSVSIAESKSVNTICIFALWGHLHFRFESFYFSLEIVGEFTCGYLLSIFESENNSACCLAICV